MASHLHNTGRFLLAGDLYTGPKSYISLTLPSFIDVRIHQPKISNFSSSISLEIASIQLYKMHWSYEHTIGTAHQQQPHALILVPARQWFCLDSSPCLNQRRFFTLPTHNRRGRQSRSSNRLAHLLSAHHFPSRGLARSSSLSPPRRLRRLYNLLQPSNPRPAILPTRRRTRWRGWHQSPSWINWDLPRCSHCLDDEDRIGGREVV
ncbi:hypothetical protein GGS26DRAFT_272032 [Hypomontagnella submonticulosa]|nr:hypothetical protein GGS26DRAFT_272032 [Hypomontagnella submonticulosa]